MTDTFAVDRASSEVERPGRSIGILGGTFNPPHLGHLALARQALAQLGLERVLVIPASTSPFKPATADPGAEHRLQMCRLLVQGAGGVFVCGLEIERGGLSYTVDTLRAIHASDPDAQLTLILGADTASTLASWREPAELLELARPAVAPRPGTDRGQVLETLTPLTDARAIRFLDSPALEVSSSLARERAAAGKEIDDLVGDPVAGYVARYGLYGPPSAPPRSPGRGRR